jgi:hypothetical protein
MAFRKDVWRRVDGFPEHLLLGEDTVFDLKVRSLVRPTFAERAKAFYRPGFSLCSALRQLARYSVSDGVAGVRPARLMRNLSRCLLQIAAVSLASRSVILLLCVIAVEVYYAFRLDWRDLRAAPPRHGLGECCFHFSSRGLLRGIKSIALSPKQARPTRRISPDPPAARDYCLL